MDLLAKKEDLKEISVDEFLELYGATERDITSDRWLTQIEKNGHGLYYLDGQLESIVNTWDDEFDGERGSVEDNLDIWDVDGLFVAMWNW